MSKTTSSFERLKQLVPPPAEPVEAGPMSLRRSVEQSLGLALPDYLFTFGMTYGTGSFGTPDFGELLKVCNPFSHRFAKRVIDWANTFLDIKASEGDGFIPHDIYPARPGLFPFGDDDSGRFIFWLTEGEPNEWLIFVWPLERKFKRIDRPLGDFVFQLFSGKIDCWGGDKDAVWFQEHVKTITFHPAKRSKARNQGQVKKPASAFQKRRKKKGAE